MNIIYIIILNIFIYITNKYNSNNLEWQFRYNIDILPIPINLTIDGINLVLILLVLLIWPIINIIRDKYNNEDIKFQYVIFILGLILIILFLANNILLFYIMFELLLIPMFLLILIYGSNFNKIEASYKLFIYTFIGFLFFLLSIIILYIKYGTVSNELLELLLINENFYSMIILWFFIFLPFAIKVPMYPVHIWLPVAHVEGSTTGSIILAAILLKLGIYGMIRYNINLLNDISIYISTLIITIAFISILYGNLTTIRQIDIKKIIAYSSIIHMNYVIFSLFSFEFNSLLGSFLTMITHALISSALFMLIGILYRRYFTRNILYYKGLTNVIPIFSILCIYFIFSNISLPLTSSFPGELLLLLGSYKNSSLITILVILLLFISTIFNIYILNRVLFGKLTNYLTKFKDISYNEFISFLPLILFSILFSLSTIQLLNLPYLRLLLISIIIIINYIYLYI